jgi:hypothetical protein
MNIAQADTTSTPQQGDPMHRQPHRGHSVWSRAALRPEAGRWGVRARRWSGYRQALSGALWAGAHGRPARRRYGRTLYDTFGVAAGRAGAMAG